MSRVRYIVNFKDRFFFSQILNSRLDLYLKLKKRGEGEEQLCFQKNEDLKRKSITT